MERPKMLYASTVLDAPDPPALGAFYGRLLGWTVRVVDETWVTVRPADGSAGISVQLEPLYRPPVWPAQADAQQMMSHLDFGVADLDEAVQWAEEAGATLAGYQPQSDVRVMLDPAGHPFCLFYETTV